MNLHPTQQAAIDIDAPRVAVLAAPGSGKTAVLTRRAVRLLATFHSSEVLLCTFTNAAAAEMRERIAAALPERERWKARKMVVSTIHSVALRALREYHDLLGMHERFSVYDDRDEDDLLIYAGRELGVVPAPGAKPKAGQVKSPRSLRGKPEVVGRVQSMLREAQAVTYDGMEEAFLGLLRHPIAGPQLRRRWPHVLVDEAQDLSDTQHRIFAALRPDNLFMVGDFAQSIYGFRGARVDLFTSLADLPEWTRLEMPVNWRSLLPIVDAATRLGRAMATPGLDQEAGRPGDISESWVLDELSGRERGEYLRAIVADMRGEHDKPLSAPWSAMAALAPTWHQLDQIAEALAEAGIPHRIARRTASVWESEAARWAVQCLRVAANPHDHIALWSAINAFTPRVSTGEWAGVRASAVGSSTPILDHATERLRASAGWRLLVVLSRARDLVRDGDGMLAIDVVCRVLTDMLGEDLHLTNKAADLAAFKTAHAEWVQTSEGGIPTVADFLDAWSTRELDKAEPEPDEAPDAVTLTTVHGAKGLEWPCVWVLGCEPAGRRPWPATGDGPGFEEALRMFYVALTRGRDRVRLCWSETRGRSPFVGVALGPQAATTPAAVLATVDEGMPF